MKIGLFVGSFDPIHVGHINVLDYLIDNKYLDKIILMPTKNYWGKQGLTDINIRYEMMKLIKRDYLILDNVNNKFDYTYQILDVIHTLYPYDEISLIMAADNIVHFDKWKNAKKILHENKVIVLNRNNIQIDDYIVKYDDKENFVVIQDFPFIDISSTELRDKLNENYLDKNVYDYIIKKKLYKKR